MRNYVIIPIIITMLAVTLTVGDPRAGEPENPNFDLSSVVEFWPVVDILTDHREPSEEEWQRLFDSTGHNTLRREFSDQIFMEYMRAAYMPSMSALRAEILAQADTASGWFLRWFPRSEIEALEWALANRKLVDAEARSLETYAYTRLATREALAFLPESQVAAAPRVAFVIFNDSRGYDPVIMSLNLLAKKRSELPEELERKLTDAGHSENWPLVLYFAHEFFHHYRALKTGVIFPSEDDPDYVLVWLIDQIENEGIADQINVPQLYTGDAPFAGSELAAEEMEGRDEAAAEIETFGGILAEIARNPEAKEELIEKAFETITRSGHVAGFYMSSLILTHFPRERLAKVARNPFEFFYLYNEAAAMHNQTAKADGHAPVFPDEAIGLLQQMQSEYEL